MTDTAPSIAKKISCVTQPSTEQFFKIILPPANRLSTASLFFQIFSAKLDCSTSFHQLDTARTNSSSARRFQISTSTSTSSQQNNTSTAHERSRNVNRPPFSLERSAHILCSYSNQNKLHIIYINAHYNSACSGYRLRTCSVPITPAAAL